MLQSLCINQTKEPMHQSLKGETFYSFFTLVTLLTTQCRKGLGFAPQGCEFDAGVAICQFRQWKPPLSDKDFGPEKVYQVKLIYINGVIPAGAFSGLNGSLFNRETQMYLNCYKGETILSRNIFTSNLHWLEDLRIYMCYLKDGLPSRLLDNLKSLKKLSIWRGEIEGMVVHDTLAGLTNLQNLLIHTPVKNGSFPAGLFDRLRNLTRIDLRDAELDVIPPNWFDKLFSLEVIYLSNNNLQTLPAGLFNDLRALRYVHLNNNPWHCSCGLLWLFNWLHKTGGGECQSPSLLEKVHLKDALGQLECPSTPGFSVTKTAETQESSIPISSASLTLGRSWASINSTSRLKTSSSLQKERTPLESISTEKIATHVTSTTNPIILTTTFTPEITKITSQTIKTTTHSTVSLTLTMLQAYKAALSTRMTIETTPTSILVNTAITSEARILTVSDTMRFPSLKATKSGISLSSFSLAFSKPAKIYHSATPRGFVSHKDATRIDDSTKYVVVSIFGALTLLFIIVSSLHRCGSRSKCVGSLDRGNRVNDDENNRPDTEPDNRDGLNSSSLDT